MPYWVLPGADWLNIPVTWHGSTRCEPVPVGGHLKVQVHLLQYVLLSCNWLTECMGATCVCQNQGQSMPLGVIQTTNQQFSGCMTSLLVVLQAVRGC